MPIIWASEWIGAAFREKLQSRLEGPSQEDFDIIMGASLTLLALMIGFTFSMAVSRYDLRKSYEEQEANAIGTEYLRAGLLPAAEAGKVKTLLRSYIDLRIVFYEMRDLNQVDQISARTARLEAEMWSVVAAPAAAQATPTAALILSGMNDVINSQGYTQAAWWNRIPIAAWVLLAGLSIFCNVLIGYGCHGRSLSLFLILPIALSLSFFLIADIDSPHRGVIRVVPQNLVSLAASLHAE